MSNPDQGPRILAFALATAVVGLIFAYNFAKAEGTATPFHPALGFSIVDPDGKDVPVYFGVVKLGFATEEECMSEGAGSPEFSALVKQMGNILSAKLGGIKIKTDTGCVDITKLPSPPPADDDQPKGDEL